MNINRVESALRVLDGEGFSTAPLWAQLTSLVASREGAVPTEDDTRWPLLAACSIEEHLTGETRPVLSCSLDKGRMYTLSPAQRSVLREWFNMIPSPEVEVVEVSVFANAPLRLAREVILKTTPHRPHGTLVNGPRVVTISSWGRFCSQVAATEATMRQQAEVAALTKRVAVLLRRAEEAGVDHDIRAAGTLAYPWHAAVEQKKIVEPQAIREELRALLLSRGEHGLVRLVKEPFFLDESKEKSTKASVEYELLLTALGLNQ